MSRYKLILFDLDGTLTDSKEGITKSARFALNKFGICVDNPEDLVKFIGPPLVESFMRYYCFDRDKAWQAVAFFREYFAVTGIFENSVIPGIPVLLEHLKELGCTLAVATSKPTVFSEKILEHFQLMKYFDRLIGSSLDSSRMKKDEIVRDALAYYDKDYISHAVMVGDREHDILGAAENGIDSIAVTYGYGSLEELNAARPTHLVHTVAELEKFLCEKV